MEPLEFARARQQGYTLLGEILLDGVSERWLPHVRALPTLVATLPATPEPDELAARYQALWGFDLFPFESLFLSAEGLVGTRSDLLLSHYRRQSFQPRAESADHLGAQFLFLAWLAQREAAALAQRDQAQLGALHGAQRAFLEEHLLRWFPALLAALARQGAPFYQALLAMGAELLKAHHAALTSEPPPPWALPAAPELLADERAGLREIAAYLLAPPHSGLFLSRSDLGRLAGALAVPCGFGSRQQVAETLLRSAAQYDALPTLFTLLRALLAEEERALKGAGWAAPLVAPWQARLRTSDQLLAGLLAQLTP